jgi:hypothetical protein
MAPNILITGADLHEFLQKLAVTQAAEIRTLTIKIDYTRLPVPSATTQAPVNDDDLREHGSIATQALWAQLQSLSRALQHMANLHTFALLVTSRPSTGFWLPRHIIADLVTNLPQQCRNVEINTRAQDSAEPDSAHLCEAIRHILLPRLHHLRLCLSTMCQALFTSDTALTLTSDQTPAAESKPTAPLLKTVFVSCVGRAICNSGARLCGSYDEDPHTMDFRTGIEAAPILAQSLRSLILKCPALEVAVVMDVTPPDYDDKSVYPSYNVRDAIKNKTNALPFHDVLPFEDGNTLIRLTDGQELISSRAAIQDLAEGRVWKEGTDGIRLPAAMYLGEGAADDVAKEEALLTVEAWKGGHPKKTCHLWLNERNTGLQLLRPTVFDGVTEKPILREDTPVGWLRNGTDLFSEDE